MLTSWKRHRDALRRREAALTAVLGACAGACFAQSVRDRARNEVTLVTGSRL